MRKHKIAFLTLWCHRRNIINRYSKNKFKKTRSGIHEVFVPLTSSDVSTPNLNASPSVSSWSYALSNWSREITSGSGTNTRVGTRAPRACPWMRTWRMWPACLKCSNFYRNRETVFAENFAKDMFHLLRVAQISWSWWSPCGSHITRQALFLSSTAEVRTTSKFATSSPIIPELMTS